MAKILLEIIGSQRVDDQSDKIELTTVGTIKETDDSYIIEYNEQQPPPHNPIAVCVTIRRDETSAEMTRTGETYSCLTIEKNERHHCHYGTEYGDILMGISGHTIEIENDGTNGSVYLAYDIDINGAIVSRNDIKLTFKAI